MPPDKQIILDPASAEILREMRRTLANVRGGPGIEVNVVPGGGITISLTPAPIRKDTPQPQIYAKVTNADRDEDNWRWVYTVQPVRLKSQGYGGWEAIDAAGTATAYNTLENMNGAAGLMGNGIDIDDLPDGMELQPAPTGAIFPVEMLGDESGVAAYWFTYSNGVAGDDCAGAE